MEIEEVLQSIGLENKEIKIYLALLGEPESTATKISKLTSIDRTFIYELLNKLIEKGLASYVIKNNIKYFSAVDPGVLLKNLEEKREQLKNILPELKAKQKLIKSKTKVEIFQSKKGVSNILKLMASIGKDYFFIGGLQEICTKFENDAHLYVQIAKNLKSKGKIIARKKDNFFIGKNEDYRFVPDRIISSTSTLISGNKVAIFIWSEPYFAILIENEEVAKNTMETFNYFWNLAERPSKSDRRKRLAK